MIQSTNELQQSVAINSNVLFSNDTLRTRNASCCGFLEHEEGSGLFTLTKNGIYKITFRTNIASATANDVLGLVMISNGENLTGTQMDYTVATANVNQEVSTTRLVYVCNGSKTIAIKNNSTTNTTPMLVENSNIIIEKKS